MINWVETQFTSKLAAALSTAHSTLVREMAIEVETQRTRNLPAALVIAQLDPISCDGDMG